MTTPHPYSVTLHTEATVNGQVVTAQESVSTHLWESLPRENQEGMKNILRYRLGAVIGTSINFPVTVTYGEPQVMTTGGAAPGHGGSVRVTSLAREEPSAGVPVEYQGSVIIVWSEPGVQFGESVVLLDADSGQRITSAVEMKLTASPREVVAAELLMLVDEQGAPLADGTSPILTDDGQGPRTGVFHWLVAGMRAATDEVPEGPVPDVPRRGDQFEQWLKARRDEFGYKGPTWVELDNVVNLYRLHADTGTPLAEHVCEARAVGDCDCLEKAPIVSFGQPDTDTAGR
jgi:hypothetical protein